MDQTLRKNMRIYMRSSALYVNLRMQGDHVDYAIWERYPMPFTGSRMTQKLCNQSRALCNFFTSEQFNPTQTHVFRSSNCIFNRTMPLSV